jgi:hypothetical protein
MLAVSGVAVGHILGYAVAHPDAAAREAALGGHAYLPATASVVIPLGVVAALVWAVRTSRQLGLAGTIPFRTLLAAQVGVFAVQELGERVLAGEPASAVLVERGVWFGLVAQVLVAYLITRSVDAVRRVVHLLTGGGRVLRDLVDIPVSSVPVVVRVQRSVAVSVGLRAPPAVGAR